MNKTIKRHQRVHLPIRNLLRTFVTVMLSAGLSGLAQTVSTPSAAAGPAMAKRVFVMGDSMGELVSYALKKELTKYAGTSFDSFISLGSGLARNDLFDWPAKLRSTMTTFQPNVIIIIIGMTDDQKMKAGGNLLAFGTPEWTTEYGRRVREIMDICRAGGTKTMLWVGLPDVRDPQTNRDMKIITGILEEQAASRPGSQYMDITSLFSTTPGQYSPYILKKDGMPLIVRSSDGKHYSPAGADLLSQAIITKLEKELH